MKFTDDIDWIIAMDKLQGDIPDPTSALPNDEVKPTSHNATQNVVMSRDTSNFPSHASRGRPKIGNSKKS